MVEEIGPIVANSIKEFFDQQQTKNLILRLKKAGVNTERLKDDNEDDRFAGKTFVLTGSLEKYSREEAGGKTEESTLEAIRLKNVVPRYHRVVHSLAAAS